MPPMPPPSSSSPVPGDMMGGPYAPDNDTVDMSNGYRICLDVLPDGTFTVEKAPLPADPSTREPGYEETPGADAVENFEDALRSAFRIYKDNPVDGSEQSSFDAGFAGQGPKERY